MAERTAILLATAFVVVAGLAVCGFIISAFADSITRPMIVCAGVATVVCFVVWLLSAKPRRKALETNMLWLFRGRQRDEVSYYVPRRRPEKPVNCDFGTNRPPTVESVRQIKEESTTTWVPSRQSPESKPPGSKV